MSDACASRDGWVVGSCAGLAQVTQAGLLLGLDSRTDRALACICHVGLRRAQVLGVDWPLGAETCAGAGSAPSLLGLGVHKHWACVRPTGLGCAPGLEASNGHGHWVLYSVLTCACYTDVRIICEQACAWKGFGVVRLHARHAMSHRQ